MLGYRLKRGQSHDVAKAMSQEGANQVPSSDEQECREHSKYGSVTHLYENTQQCPKEGATPPPRPLNQMMHVSQSEEQRTKKNGPQLT